VTRYSSVSRIPRLVAADELRHRAFLQTLAHGDPTSADWLAARAGLLVLRYVDAWATGEWLPVQLLAEHSAVADAICEIPRGSEFRGLLAVLLDRTKTEWAISVGGEAYPLPVSVGRIAAPLLAYAHALQFSSQWALAADVYSMVWDSCGPHGIQAARGLEDVESATTAALRLAACYRTLGETDRSAAAYAAAVAIARERGDVRTILQARLGEARLVQDRGNLPLADQQIAAVIREATTAQLQDIRAWAYHDRSAVAYHRERYREAIEWGFEAWAIERSSRHRERVLCDLASALLGGGYRELARAAHQLLAATAGEPLIRWASTINLIEIAVLDRNEQEFDRCRRTLIGLPLPPDLSAGFHYYAGLGEIAFGRVVRACTELERAIAVAEQHGLGEIVIKAEAAMAGIRDGRAAKATPRAAPVPPEFAHISDALHGACAAALMGAD
jgi:hypothetical protein